MSIKPKWRRFDVITTLLLRHVSPRWLPYLSPQGRGCHGDHLIIGTFRNIRQSVWRYFLCNVGFCFVWILAVSYACRALMLAMIHRLGIYVTQVHCESTWSQLCANFMKTSSNETLSILLTFCAGNSPVTGEFPAQRPVTWSLGVFFELRLNKRLSIQSRRRWFETPPRSLWRHCNVIVLQAHTVALKTESCHNANFFVVIGGTGGCRDDNLRCHKGRQMWCCDDWRLSM